MLLTLVSGAVMSTPFLYAVFGSLGLEADSFVLTHDCWLLMVTSWIHPYSIG